MSALLEAMKDIPIPRKVWTREEARQLLNAGFPGATSFELVNGEIIDRMGKNPPHVFWKTVVRQWLEKVFGGDHVRTEDPIDVAPEDNPISEPEPDLIVTSKSIRESAENPKPDDLILVVEISDTTLQYDRKIKGALYARAGIREYWVVDVAEGQLIVHRRPENGTYADVRCYASDEVVVLSAAGSEFHFCLGKL